MFRAGVRKNICTAPFLNAQELLSWSAWKVNVYIPVYLRLKISGGVLNNFLQADRCLGLFKYFKISF